jgi:tRNA(Ile)-lysidine synthase
LEQRLNGLSVTGKAIFHLQRVKIMSASFDHTIESTLQRHGMLEKGDHIVVAVSGGPDSVVLLHVLHHLRIQWELTLIVAHLNHTLRGSDSEEDAAFVAGYANALGLPCVVERADVKRYCRTQKCSLETGAREVRYAFLERVARTYQATKIATGHTADDQAETVLMRLVRGSGPAGLSGIRPVRDGWIIRPLLDITRSAVLTYQATHRLSARCDVSNGDKDMLRNKIRHHLMPVLQADYNPEIQGALTRLADVMRVESDYLDRELEDLSVSLVHPVDRHIVSIDLASWQTKPIALQRRLVRRIVQAAGGQPMRLTYDHVEQARGLCDAGHVGQMLHLPDEVILERRKTTVMICRGVSEPYRIALNITGTTPIPASDYDITTAVVNISERPENLSPTCVLFDADDIPPRLFIRPRQAGDRMTPFGMSGTKTLKKLFNEWDIPRLMRDRVPIVTDGSQILWVAGHRRGNQAPITEQTRNVLVIQYVSR